MERRSFLNGLIGIAAAKQIAKPETMPDAPRVLHQIDLSHMEYLTYTPYDFNVISVKPPAKIKVEYPPLALPPAKDE